MTVVLEARALVVTPEIPQANEHADAADALEEIIASHRAALLALAPHQEDRAARVETGWHMEHLGLLLGVRDAQTQNSSMALSPLSRDPGVNLLGLPGSAGDGCPDEPRLDQTQ